MKGEDRLVVAVERLAAAWERMASASEFQNQLTAQMLAVQMQQAQTAQALEQTLMDNFGKEEGYGEYIWAPDEDEDDDDGTRH